MENLEKTLKELNNENLYKILHIEKSKDNEKIKKAYKKAIKKYHPDKNKEKNTVEIFEKIRKAYEILQNEDSKALYDSYLNRRDDKIKRVKIFSEKRKKFADDLKKKEEEHLNSKNQKDKSSEDKSNDNKNVSYYRKSNFFSDPQTNEPVIKTKSIEDKLITSGVKVKWSKDSQFLFTKEIIYTYFKEFGTIEEIICKEEEFKAYILFVSNRSVITLMSSFRDNKTLSTLFKIKKCESKVIENDPIVNIKSAYLDSKTLESIKNMKLLKNAEFMKEKSEKEKEIDKNKNNTNINTVNSEIKKENILNRTDISLEDFEKAAFENFKLKFKK